MTIPMVTIQDHWVWDWTQKKWWKYQLRIFVVLWLLKAEKLPLGSTNLSVMFVANWSIQLPYIQNLPMTRSFPCTHVYCTQLWDWKVALSIGGEFCLSTNVKNCSINMSIRKRVLVLRKAKLVKKAHHLRNLSLQHHQTVYLSVCCISNIKNAFKISVDSNFSVY